jgi:hypothetical protein
MDGSRNDSLSSRRPARPSLALRVGQNRFEHSSLPPYAVLPSMSLIPFAPFVLQPLLRPPACPLTSIELWPSFVIFSYVKNAVKEEYAENANDRRRKAQTNCQVYTESNSGRGNKSPETPPLPPEKSYCTRQIEQNEYDQERECPIGNIRTAAFDCSRSK